MQSVEYQLLCIEMNPFPEPFRTSGDITTIDELLRAYPNLAFNPQDEESLLMWKDVVKAATPKNHKKELVFDIKAMNRLMAEEMYKLIVLRNILLRAMKDMGNRATKVALLKAVSEKTGFAKSFSLGGGRRPDTRRLILIYEAEADVTAKKRKSCKRRCYRPRKKCSSEGKMDPVMHGDAFENLFDEEYCLPSDSFSSACSSSSSSTGGSVYSSGDDLTHAYSWDDVFQESGSDDDFEVIKIDEFDEYI